MSRYIDADALDRAFSKLRFNNDGELKHYGDRPNWYLWGSEVENLIADAPSIDIVRCKECRWASPNGKYGCMLKPFSKNDWQYHHLFSDDFCSYGVKKGADDDSLSM